MDYWITRPCVRSSEAHLIERLDQSGGDVWSNASIVLIPWMPRRSGGIAHLAGSRREAALEHCGAGGLGKAGVKGALRRPPAALDPAQSGGPTKTREVPFIDDEPCGFDGQSRARSAVGQKPSTSSRKPSSSRTRSRLHCDQGSLGPLPDLIPSRSLVGSTPGKASTREAVMSAFIALRAATRA